MIKPSVTSAFFNPTNWFFIILILSIFSVARPTVSKVKTPFNQDASKTIVAIYVGESMGANDIKPSRIERLKIKLEELFKVRPSSQYSLVTYTANAYQILPLTRDTKILTNFAKALTTDMAPVSGRSESSLAPLIFKTFKEGEKGQNLLLVTDEVSIEDSKNLRALLNKYQIHFSIYGIGDETIELENFQYNDTSLVKLASLVKANYIPYSAGNTDIREISESLEEYYPISDDDQLPWKDLGYYMLYFLFIPFVLFFRKGWIARLGIFGALILSPLKTQHVQASPFLSPFLTPDQQAKFYFNLGNYQKAAKYFKNQYYKGISYYLAQDFKNAEISLSNLDSPEAKFAHANSVAHLGYYLSAMEEYQDLLKEAPQYEKQAKANIIIMQALVAEVDSMSESQRPEGEELARVKKEKFKVARGSKSTAQESNTNDSSKKLDVNTWMKKVNAPLEDFLVRKLQVLESNKNEN